MASDARDGRARHDHRARAARSTSSTRPSCSSSGPGPAGLAAALAGARAGVEVTLVERFGCFGGNITAVGVEGMAWYRHEATVEAGGIALEFETRAHEMGAAVPESQSLSLRARCRGLQARRRRARRGGGHPPDAAPARSSPPCWTATRSLGIVTESKAGREAILARRVIDATGDADVAHRAGAPTHLTPREEMLAASVMFHLAGVDKAAFLAGVAADPQTYARLGGQRGVGHRDLRQGGRPVLAVPPRAVREGDRGRGDPGRPDHDRRHLGRDPRHRRADVHEPRAPRRHRRHRPRRPHPRRDRGPAAGDARDRGAPPLHARLRGAPACATSA